VEYLGINVADSVEDARAFVAEKGFDWPQLHDPDRALARELGADYQPYFAAVNEEGEVVAVHDGGADDAIWADLIAQLERHSEG
jgi:peroxiredoxin